jgi:phage terminase large subunit-like protein
MTSARPRRRRMRTGLLPEATRLVLPKGITSSAYPSTEAVCAGIGIFFDPWEADLNRCLLAKTRSGLYAADTAVLSIPRQVGKTFDVGAVVFADSIIHPGTTTVWTAHRFKVARETFNEMRSWAKSPLLKQHIDYDAITTGAGNECIPFRNGSRLMFAARERGAIRGFTKVRRLVLDEAQILSEAALSDLVPTMNQAFNPQLVLMCTPPKPGDPCEVVTRLRQEALDGETEGVLYVELSAPPDCDPGDRAAWAKANPSYPRRTPAKALLRMRKLLSAEDFRREALGIWDSDAGAWLVIGHDSWAAAGREGALL